MKIDGVSFSDEFVKSFKTEEEFLTAMSDGSYKHIYEGQGRKEALIKAYGMHNPKAAEKTAEKDTGKPKAEDNKASKA